MIMKGKSIKPTRQQALKGFLGPTGTDNAKPPLGVMPQQIWMEKRAKELARAIHQYIDAGMYEPVDEWVEELDELWQKIIDGWDCAKGCDKDNPPF
jgi:hypothetical protein